MNIYSGSREGHGLAAALTNPTELSFKKGTVHQHYPVRFRVVDYVDAELAYNAWKEEVGWRNMPALEILVAEIIACKLRQHPRLVKAISKHGGVAWLETCEHQTFGRTQSFKRWEGNGRQSAFLRALIIAYEEVLTQPEGGVSCSSSSSGHVRLHPTCWRRCARLSRGARAMATRFSWGMHRASMRRSGKRPSSRAFPLPSLARTAAIVPVCSASGVVAIGRIIWPAIATWPSVAISASPSGMVAHAGPGPPPDTHSPWVNFEEWPYFKLAKSGGPDKVLTYEQWTTLPDGHRLRQRWTVIAPPDGRLPGPFDMDVKRALERLMIEQGFEQVIERGWLAFSFRQVAEILGIAWKGQVAQAIFEALERLRTTEVRSYAAFYLKDTGEFIDSDSSADEKETIPRGREARIRLLSEVAYDNLRHQAGLAIDPEQVDRCTVYFGPHYLRNLKARYLRTLDFTLYQALHSPLAKRLYSLLQGVEGPRVEYSLLDLAPRLPLTAKYPSKIREKLHPACVELQAQGVLKGFVFDNQHVTLTLANEPKARWAEVMVEDILAVTEDPHSRGWYRKLAQLLPSDLLHAVIAETRDAKHQSLIRTSPGAYFTDLLKRRAAQMGLMLPLGHESAKPPRTEHQRAEEERVEEERQRIEAARATLTPEELAELYQEATHLVEQEHADLKLGKDLLIRLTVNELVKARCL